MKLRLIIGLLGVCFLIGGVNLPSAHAGNPKAIDSEPILKKGKAKKKIKKKGKKKTNPKSIDSEPILKKK